MSNDLEQMESELKKLYSCEVEFTQSTQIQNVISYCNFNTAEIKSILNKGIALGPKSGMFPASPKFYKNTSIMSWAFKRGERKIKWAYCENIQYDPPVLYVLVFPASNELKYYNYLKRASRLRVFL